MKKIPAVHFTKHLNVLYHPSSDKTAFGTLIWTLFFQWFTLSNLIIQEGVMSTKFYISDKAECSVVG